MKMHGVILTDNFNGSKVLDFLEFDTPEAAEKAYQENKNKNIGVIKVNIEKAHQFTVTRF